MAQKAIRFGISDGETLCASTWKLWTEKSGDNSEIYLACRGLGGELKASLHQSGKCHIAFSQRTFQSKVKKAIPRPKDRFLEKWTMPKEISEGTTLAFRIVTPYSAVNSSKKTGNNKKVKWIQNAKKPYATEIDIIITKPSVKILGWPGKNKMKTSLVDSFVLNNGNTVWVVYWAIDMPDLSKLNSGSGNFFEGKNNEDLESKGLRAMVFGNENDGSRVIYDCAVRKKLKS